jgi:beta-mannosidase
MRAGLIGDPRNGLNHLSARWVEEQFWSYRKDFDAPGEIAGQRVWVNFECLYLGAEIVLNGEVVGTHNNAFRPCRIDVTGKVKPGANRLVVHLESGLYGVADKPLAGFENSPDQRLHKRHWLRAPQCQFAWDWSPRLLNVGISGPVTLEYTADPVRVDRLVPIATLDPSLTNGALLARLFVEGLTDVDTAATLNATLTPPNGGAPLSVTSNVTVKPGMNPVEASITIDNPELWWPVGHGAQPLHDVSVTLTVNGTQIAERTARVGFRHVLVNQDPHPNGGRYFVVEVNGRKIFLKGGNFVPADIIFADIDRARYETLTDRALEANFNLLRVWGGGLYESDDFYELCDAKGILVWQEFIYACGRFPMQDETFFHNARLEAVHQVRRLASHPSLIIWCGNNEMEWGAWQWGYGERGQIMPDYAFFHLTLPRILADEDGSRYYQPSSPFSPDVKQPNASEQGDQHPWDAGIGSHDWWIYRGLKCRFPNEGGCLGPNSLPTTLECLPEGQREIGSFAWRQHDNSIAELKLPGVSADMGLHFAGVDFNTMTVEEFVYWGGLLQGEALREYIDNFRRREFDSAAAIFWMYNDTWPTTRSWTIVDYALRRTPAFCPVKRAFQPVSVVVVEEVDEIVVYGINDTQAAVTASLRYGVLSLTGERTVDLRKDVTLGANASTPLARFPLASWTATDPLRDGSVAFASLESGGALIARNRLFATLFRSMRWPEATVRVTVADGIATFTADVFAWGVCVDVDGETALADNFFDVWPGEAYSIPWPSQAPPKIVGCGNAKGNVEKIGSAVGSIQ